MVTEYAYRTMTALIAFAGPHGASLPIGLRMSIGKIPTILTFADEKCGAAGPLIGDTRTLIHSMGYFDNRDGSRRCGVFIET